MRHAIQLKSFSKIKSTRTMGEGVGMYPLSCVSFPFCTLARRTRVGVCPRVGFILYRHNLGVPVRRSCMLRLAGMAPLASPAVGC